MSTTVSPTFLEQLAEFKNETWRAARSLYAGWSIEHAAGRSPRVESRLNESPRFWHSVMASCQEAGYLTLGRIYDHDGKTQYNVSRLVAAAEREAHLFTRRAHSARRIADANGTVPTYLEGWLLTVYEPSTKDFRALRKKVSEHRRLYERLINPVRNKALAHRELGVQDGVESLYEGGTNRELWSLLAFLLELHEVLHQLYTNGRSIVFRDLPMDLDSLFLQPAGLSLPHAWIVDDVDKLLERICPDWRAGTVLAQ